MKTYLEFITELKKVELFDHKKTGKPKFDRWLSGEEEHPGVSLEIEYMTPLQAKKAMAKGQGTTLAKAMERRIKKNIKGGQEHIDKMAKQMASGVKFHIPYLDYRNGGFLQDGYHRLTAAESILDKNDKVPVLVVKSK